MIKNAEIKALADAVAAKALEKPKEEDKDTHADNVRDCVEALVSNFVDYKGYGLTVRKGKLLREAKAADAELSGGELVAWLKKALTVDELVQLDYDLRETLRAAAL